MNFDRASVLTRITALYVDKLAAAEFAPFGLSLAQYKIIAYLYAKPKESVTTSELEAHFQMSHSTSVGLLNNLEKDGWITRKKTPQSGRSKVILLTQRAIKEKPGLEKAGAALEKEFTRPLTEEEKEEYIRISKKILGTG